MATAASPGAGAVRFASKTHHAPERVPWLEFAVYCQTAPRLMLERERERERPPDGMRPRFLDGRSMKIAELSPGSHTEAEVSTLSEIPMNLDPRPPA